MNNLFRNKSFAVGFLTMLGLFLAVNLYTFLPERSSAVTFDKYETYGFPFALYESGTILHLNQFIKTGLIADALIAIAFSFITGLVLKSVWSKLFSQRMQ